MSESIIRKPGLAKIDPEWEAFEQQFPVPPLLGTPQQLRLRLKFPKTNSPPVGYSIRDVEVPGYLDATNQLRLYTPNDSSEPLPVVIYVHGGGWTIGDLDSEDKVCRTMCNSAGVIVASVDYRKAPENPFPIGLEDVWQGVFNNIESLGGASDRIIIGGLSAGGNIAAVLAQRAQNVRNIAFRGQILRVPLVVHTDAIPPELDFSSYAENAKAPILPAAAVIQCLGYYGAPPEEIRISPLLAKDHSGLPPAYIQVAGADPLRDDGFAYAEKLQKAGVPVRSKPWYITTAVTDVRPPNGEFVAGRSSELDSSQELSVFVSVPHGYGASPDGRDIRVCSHMMGSVNKTSDNPTDARYSCKGVISDKCVKEYENATLLVPALGQPCPDFTSIMPDLSEECREQVFAGISTARNFSSTRCSLDKMPYLDLPANYTTFGTDWAGFDGDGDREDFDRYDERVQRSIPVLMAVANGNDSSESKLFCIAPDQVVQGSRKPESKLGDQEEDENRASRVGSPSDFTDDTDILALFFNASGTLPLKLKGQKDPFYISAVITDKRDENRGSEQWLNGFISVPRPLAGSIDNGTIGVCSFMFQGLNGSSENPDDADQSCKGVMSDACIEELENSTLPIDTTGNCRRFEAFNLSDECKEHLTNWGLVEPRNISEGNCTIDKIPSLDVPDGYRMYGGSLSSGEAGGEYDEFDSYDIRVQQTIPIFTVVSGGGINDRKVMCVAPNKIVPGSRKPELKLEDEANTAARVGGLGAVFFSVGVMIFSLLTSENPPDMDAPDNPSYANHSCKGVVSEKCIGGFENSTHGIPARAAKCPTLYSLDLSDECKDGFGIGLFSNEDRKDFDMYDLRVQQTMPLLFSAAGMNRLICIAPDQVVPGSRKPQLKLEEDDEGKENDEEEEEEENSAPRAGGLQAATVFLCVSAIILSLL
ncbi:lipase esterase [Fusarium circinatum]|uniref:Lipase esterase n=1 Tax=Fusarium circinatum TaxID=48490 RepID=A0A8H5SWX1_FUSCI|nr:lipase esterase [Fusarium circinatum]